MTRTGYLALIVLVALVVGILAYTLWARNVPDQVADSQSIGESTREASGQSARPLSHGPLMDHLRAKFRPLYGLG